MAYLLIGETCGIVRLDAKHTGVIVTESVQRSAKVTSNPMEKGADINDHVVSEPVVFNLSAVTIGGKIAMAILRRMFKEHDVVSYFGRNRISNCIITSLKEDASADNRSGVKVSMSLKVITRVSAEYVESGEQMMSAQDADAEVSSSLSTTAAKAVSQTKKVSADGLKTKATQTISESAYGKYVDSFSSASAGPAGRVTSAYSAA